jgi:hypothetical protein
MNTFEKKLARYREAQERKRRKPMSNHHKSVIRTRLKEAIEKEKDPDRLVKLTAQYNKLNPQKRPRKSAASFDGPLPDEGLPDEATIEAIKEMVSGFTAFSEEDRVMLFGIRTVEELINALSEEEG